MSNVFVFVSDFVHTWKVVSELEMYSSDISKMIRVFFNIPAPPLLLVRLKAKKNKSHFSS